MSKPSSAVGFDPGEHPRRVNLGCGWDRRDGYLNVDFLEVHEPDLVADVRDLSLLPDGFYDEVIAQDVLEHLERSEIDPALREWARITRIGGEIVVRVPDLIGLVRTLGQQTTVEWHSTMIHCLYGTQAYNGDYHLAGFTELTLRHALHEAGFAVREIKRFDGWLFDCVAERVADPGEFDPGPLPFLAVCDHDLGAELATTAGTDEQDDFGLIDKAVSSVASRVPASVRRRGQRVWRPAREALAKRGLL